VRNRIVSSILLSLIVLLALPAVFAVGVGVSYSVTFRQTGIPTGTTWGVTVRGNRFTSTASSTTVVIPSGTYYYTFDASVASGGSKYWCMSRCTGSVSGPTTVTETYTLGAGTGFEYLGVYPIYAGTGSDRSGRPYAMVVSVQVGNPIGTGGLERFTLGISGSASFNQHIRVSLNANNFLLDTGQRQKVTLTFAILPGTPSGTYTATFTAFARSATCTGVCGNAGTSIPVIVTVK